MLSFQLKSAEGLLQEPQECREQPDHRAGGWGGRLLRLGPGILPGVLEGGVGRVRAGEEQRGEGSHLTALSAGTWWRSHRRSAESNPTKPITPLLISQQE